MTSVSGHRRCTVGQPTSWQQLLCHLWCAIHATTWVSRHACHRWLCHQPATVASVGASPPLALPRPRYRGATVGMPLPPLPPHSHRLPPLKCLCNIILWHVHLLYSSKLRCATCVASALISVKLCHVCRQCTYISEAVPRVSPVYLHVHQ